MQLKVAVLCIRQRCLPGCAAYVDVTSANNIKKCSYIADIVGNALLWFFAGKNRLSSNLCNVLKQKPLPQLKHTQHRLLSPHRLKADILSNVFL